MQHGRDGWELVGYAWCEATGIATLTYERPGGGQVIVVRRPQPAREHHTHWYMKPLRSAE